MNKLNNSTYKSQKIKLNESPDQTCNGLDYDDEDAIPFGFINHNNKIYCVIGDFDNTHGDMCGNKELNPIEYEEIEDLGIYRRYSDGTGMYPKKIYDYAGRYWYNSNVISFYVIPEKNELIKYLNILSEKIKRDYKNIRTIDVSNHQYKQMTINIDTLKIEIPEITKRGKRKEHLELVKDYIGSDYKAVERSREELVKQHVDPKMRDQKKKDLMNTDFKGGSRKNSIKYPNSKPEDIMRLKQAMYAESIQLDSNNRLFEDPDYTYDKLHYWSDDDAIPFGFIKHDNKIYCIIGDGNDIHHAMFNSGNHFNNKETEIFKDYRKYTRLGGNMEEIEDPKYYLYSGRYWYEDNIISFWDMPDKFEILKYIKILANKVDKCYIRYEDSSDYYHSGKYKTVDLDTFRNSDERTHVIINLDTLKIEIPANENEPQHFELFKDYLKSDKQISKRSAEELVKQHVDPKMRDQKKKDLFDKGFVGGSKKNSIKYPNSKPEDIMRLKQAMYAESVDENLIKESPDYVELENGNILRYSSNGAVAFGFLELDNKLYCAIGENHYELFSGQLFINTDVIDAIQQSYPHKYISIVEEIIDKGRAAYLYPGRLWLNEKVITFWKMPKYDIINKYLDVIKDVVKQKINIDINFDNYQIELPNSEESGKSNDFEKNYLTSFEWGDRYSIGKLIPLKDYINNKVETTEWNAQALAKQHVDPKMRDQKKEKLMQNNFKGGSRKDQLRFPGSKPEDIMRLKQAMQAESINLNESPDHVIYNDRPLEYGAAGALAFGFLEIDNKIYCAIGKNHFTFFETYNINRDVSREIYRVYSKDDDYTQCENMMNDFSIKGRECYLYPGRLWSKEKIISFWEIPPYHIIQKYLDILKNKINNTFTNDINFEDYQIELPNSEESNRATEFEKYLKSYEWGDRYSVGKLIALKDYINNKVETKGWNTQALAKQHVDPKMRDKKNKDLFDKGFMGGSKKNTKKYLNSKPEDIMRLKQAMRAESIQLDSNNRLFENPDITYIRNDKDEVIKRLKVTDDATYPFLLGNSNHDLNGPLDVLTWGEESSYHDGSNEEVDKLYNGESGEPIIKGRVWVNDKIISTWSNPHIKDFDIMCKFISSKVGENVMQGDWKMTISVYTDNTDIIAQKDNRSEEFASEKRFRVEKIIPVRCYKGYPGSMKTHGSNVLHNRYQKKYPDANIKPEDIMRLRQAKVKSESSESFESARSNYINALNEAELRGEPLSPSELRKLLHQKVLNFEFIKKNGEHRKAKGTTVMKKIPSDAKPKGGKSSPSVVPFYDLKKQDWRSVSVDSPEIVQSPSFLGNIKDKIKDIFKRKEVEVEPKEIDKMDLPSIDTTDIDNISTIPVQPETTPEEVPTDMTTTDASIGIDPISHLDILPQDHIIPEPKLKPSTLVPSSDVIDIPIKPSISKINVYDDKPISPIKHYINNLRGMNSNDKLAAQKIDTQYITPDSVPQIKTIYNTTPEEEITNLERARGSIDIPINTPKIDLNVPNSVNPEAIQTDNQIDSSINL